MTHSKTEKRRKVVRLTWAAIPARISVQTKDTQTTKRIKEELPQSQNFIYHMTDSKTENVKMKYTLHNY